MLRIESPPSGKHPWTTATATVESCITKPPHVSLLFDLILPHRPFKVAYFSLRLVSLLAVSVGCYVHVTSKSSDEEKEKFLARIEWLPVTSRSYVILSQTDNCNINIFIGMCMHVLITDKGTP